MGEETAQADVEPETNPNSRESYRSGYVDKNLISVTNLNSTGSGRSKRTAKTPAVSYAERVYICDVADCSAVYRTPRGLSAHKDKRHCTKLPLSLIHI